MKPVLMCNLVGKKKTVNFFMLNHEAYPPKKESYFAFKDTIQTTTLVLLNSKKDVQRR